MTDSTLPKSSGTAEPGLEHALSTQGQRRRARILDAAERCFIDSGFHAASMAQIAAAARVSPGLIYRYFENKGALVKAIIDRHLQADGCKALDGLQTVDDVVAAILETFDHWRRRDKPAMDAVLFLELSAEGTRDLQIGKAVRETDQFYADRVVQALQRAARAGGVTLTSAEARRRAMLLQCLVQGLAVRAVRDPELSRSSLKPALERILRALVS